MKSEETAVRISESFTTRWEKRNLPKIARALPAWVTPDHLTLLGIVAALMIGAGYVLSHRSTSWLLLSVVGLFFHWFGDSLDGTLARVRKQERERYGYYVDRTADAISVVVIFVCFGLSPFLSLSVAMMVAVGYLLIMIYAEICAYTSGRFPLSFARLGPTEARIILALFTSLLIFWQPPARVLDAAGVLASGVLFLSFLVLSANEARRLDQLDRRDRTERDREDGASRGLEGSAESWL